MKKIPKRSTHLLSRNMLSTAAVIALMGAATFAAAPSGGYLPGATLDPDCAPGATDCIVQNVGTETDPLRKFVEGSGSINAVYTGGYVGIGTDKPSRDLTIASDNAYIYTRFEPGDGNIWSTGPDSAGYSFWEGSTRRVSIDNGGNVGIGTTSPNDTLYIQGDGTNGMTIRGDSASLKLRGPSTHSITGVGTARLIGPTNRSLAVEINGNNDADRFSIITDPSEESVADTESFVVLNNGNVGIGTINPASRLDVQIQDDTAFVSNHTSGGGNYQPRNTDVLQIKNEGTTGAPVGIHLEPQTVSGKTGERTVKLEALGEPGVNYGTSFVLKTRNTSGTLGERLRVTGNGNVGVGTTMPKELLHLKGIRGAIGFTDIDQFTDPNDRMYINPITDDLNIGFIDDSANTDKLIMSLKGVTGNVGIGESNPLEELVIAKSGGAILRLSTGGNSASSVNGIEFHDRENAAGQTSTGQISSYMKSLRAGTSGYYNLTFGTVGTTTGNAEERMRINGAGNVGIGTTNPESNLHIESTATNLRLSDSDSVKDTDGHYARIIMSDSNDAITGWMGFATGGKTMAFHNLNTGTGAGISIGTSGVSRLNIEANGYVGVGTSNPTEKLEVDGKIKLQTVGGPSTGLSMFNYGGDGGTNTGDVYCAQIHSEAICLAAWNNGVKTTCTTAVSTSSVETKFLCVQP